jgi:ethanolaminephosphotransferase
MAEGVVKEKKRRYRFLNSEGAAALPKFQYNGTDNSLIYKYILSPLAGFFVDNATPTWLAPNAITLTGLMFMVASYCIFYYYCPSIDSCSVEHGGIPPPSWIFVFNAAAMVIYQTLDNMDGKQARKTGSASPLGLLFDHGIDAANSIFGSVNWIIAMGLSTQDHLFHIWVMVCSSIII